MDLSEVKDSFGNTDSYIYLDVDELPELDYNGDNIVKYIADNFEWEEIYDGWSYFPVFSFVIRKDGYLTNAKTEWGMCPEIENEIIKILKRSPKWEAGKMKGKPVDVIFYLPFPFYIRSLE